MCLSGLSAFGTDPAGQLAVVITWFPRMGSLFSREDDCDSTGAGLNKQDGADEVGWSVCLSIPALLQRLLKLALFYYYNRTLARSVLSVWGFCSTFDGELILVKQRGH